MIFPQLSFTSCLAFACHVNVLGDAHKIKRSIKYAVRMRDAGSRRGRTTVGATQTHMLLYKIKRFRRCSKFSMVYAW